MGIKKTMTLKKQLYNQCQDLLNKRLGTIQHAMSDIENSLVSETKSSAGDKHETGRAMLHLEREKAGQQLGEIQKLKDLLFKINPEINHKNVALGSLVYTTKANYFIAVSVGKLQVETESFYAISPATPRAQSLVAKQVGDTVKFRNEQFTITKIE
jgi:transcription elongation GreA/GreB family factor